MILSTLNEKFSSVLFCGEPDCEGGFKGEEPAFPMLLFVWRFKIVIILTPSTQPPLLGLLAPADIRILALADARRGSFGEETADAMDDELYTAADLGPALYPIPILLSSSFMRSVPTDKS